MSWTKPLATATNLNEGQLEILGAPWSASRDVFLDAGLLASSAFPAVFRPRQSWEIFVKTVRDDKYIDGGTIDNLPLDAVARFLDEAERNKRIERRPKIPPSSLPPLSKWTGRPWRSTQKRWRARRKTVSS